MDEWESLPAGWEFLFEENLLTRLRDFEKHCETVSLCPRLCLTLRPLYELPFCNVKVVLMGQNPYPNVKQACGYSFSVPPGVAIPPSLKCIYEELKSSIPSWNHPGHGDLTPWVRKGTLLLNASLTLDNGKYSEVPHSTFWLPFVSDIVRALSKRGNVAFIFLGKRSQRFSGLVNRSTNLVLTAPHPSPRAGDGFKGCGHFQTVCEYLHDEFFWNL